MHLNIDLFSYVKVFMTILETDAELNACIVDDIDYYDFKDELHKARVVRCYDGDTMYCIFKHAGGYHKFRIRMLGYNSPEMKLSKSLPEEERAEIKALAVKAKERLIELILNKNVYLYTKGQDAFGRILATVKLNETDEISINDQMIQEGHGVVFNG